MNLVSIVDPSRLETEKRVGSVKHALGTIGVDLTGILGGTHGGRRRRENREVWRGVSPSPP